MCLYVGVCEYERAGAVEVCGTEVGVGDVEGAVHVAVTSLGEKGGTAVAKALKTNTALTQLNLCGGFYEEDIKLGEKGGTAVAEALKINTKLTELNLRSE